MSMVVERVEVDKVRAKLESLKNKTVHTQVLGKREREKSPETQKVEVVAENSNLNEQVNKDNPKDRQNNDLNEIENSESEEDEEAALMR